MTLFRRIGWIRLSIDVAVATVFLAATWSAAFYTAANEALIPLIAFVMSAALAMRRVSPSLALTVAWAGAILQMSLGMAPLAANFAIFGVLYTTAAYGTRLVMYLGLASTVVGASTIAIYLVASGMISRSVDPLTFLIDILPNALAALFGFGLSWTAGALVRAMRRADDNRRAQAVAEAEASAEHERGQIARDMHDVVAHSLAVVIAQANGARYAAKADPQVATDALGTISQTAGSALADVRMLLAQLRHREADGPQPTLADLDPLFAQVRRAGVALTVDIDPAPRDDVPAAVQLAVYRILQEALTNALRHGDGAVAVRIAWSRGSVALAVTNPASGSRPDPADGHGIIGMRERAQLAGGSLDVEHADGRFTVRAHIPWEGHE